MKGVILSFDGADGLGTIELEDGRQCRFGMSACHAFDPDPGTEVRVGELQDVRGALRAKDLHPASKRTKPRKPFSSGRESVRLDRFDQRDPRGDLGVPAGFLFKWLIRNGLIGGRPSADPAVTRRWEEGVDAVRAGTMSGRELITRYCDEKPSSTDLTEEGYRFWRHYYGRRLRLFRSRFEKDLMAASGRSIDEIFSLEEGGEHEPAILQRISRAYDRWKR
ncbi:MAG: hypothetical protein JJ863_07965 [Deltaproteobacteria bacterium]|nr:hypothetical protein [Deltaproteobacteria bacterium]